MKRILVPTDFSKCADYALKFASEIAIKNNAKLLVLHSVEHSFAGGIDPTGASVFQSFDDGLIETLLGRGRTNLDKSISSLGLPVENISHLVEIGHPSDLTIDKIREFSIDLVVMGTHGASGITEMLVGSNAEKVVRRAKCPVITLKSPTKLENIRKIAFASDFSKLSENAMAALKRMQHVMDATIDFVRVNTPNNFQRDALTKQHMDDLVTREMFLKAELHVYNDFSEEEGLLNFAEDRQSDMIGMITHGRTGLNHLMTGSIAEDVVNHTSIPVWTMRVPD